MIGFMLVLKESLRFKEELKKKMSADKPKQPLVFFKTEAVEADFAYNQKRVRNSKSVKDRTTLLTKIAQSLKELFKSGIERRSISH